MIYFNSAIKGAYHLSESEPFGMTVKKYMLKVFPKSANQSKEMALSIHCFRPMRDWKLENLANAQMVWKFPPFRSERKQGTWR